MLNYARAEGMKVMIGCMTETSCRFRRGPILLAVDFADLTGICRSATTVSEGVTS